jgi:hypothetical protein
MEEYSVETHYTNPDGFTFTFSFNFTFTFNDDE